MKKLVLISLVSFVLLGFTLQIDNELISKIDAGLKKYSEEYPQEKIYLHHDRPYYTSGETIWLKAYVVAGARNIASQLSKTVYVHLTNEKGDVIKGITLHASNGTASGYLTIPDSLKSDSYTLVAYTKWMQNFKCDFYYREPVKIWNMWSSESMPVSNQPKKIDVQFLPEGGHFVEGLLTKMAFKAIDENGLGVEISGRVLESSGKEVLSFVSNPLGMGAFTVTAVKNVNYLVELTKPEKSILHLPQVEPSGSNFYVTNAQDKKDLLVRVQTTDFSQPKTFMIVCQAGGILSYSSKLTLKTPFQIVKIPKATLPYGVNHLTLFDSEGMPLVERLVFINKDPEHKVSLKTDKVSYKPREKTEILIELTDSTGLPLAADMSISVTDGSQVIYDANQGNIESYLHLTSDLTGFVENPGYYFNNTIVGRFDALDALLLTQGWSRFTWKEIIQDQLPVKRFMPEQGISIKGRLIDKFNKKPIENGKVLFLEGGPQSDIITTETNSIGEFQLSDLQLLDSSKASIQASNKKGNKELVKIVLDSISRIPICFVLPELMETKTGFEQSFIKRSLRFKEINAAYDFDEKNYLLNEVTVKGKKLETNVAKVYGSGTNSIKSSQVPGSQSFLSPLQLIQGRVAGVQINGSGNNMTVQIRGVGSINAGNAPLILLDNVPVSVDAINRIPVQSIESVEVFKGADATIFGTQGANGVIAFYSKSGSKAAEAIPGMMPLTNIGYQVSKMFYAPKYDVKKPEDVKPDERVTLFWNPNIRSDENGKVALSYFNHDIDAPIHIVLQGVTKLGQPVYQYFSYKISKD